MNRTTARHALDELFPTEQSDTDAGWQPLRARLVFGDSPPIRQLNRTIELVASHDAPVLIVGESGSGKDLVARSVHAASTARDRPFVAMHSALANEWLQASRSQDARGAHRGASQIGKTRGPFDVPHGATLFIDEIADLSLEMQLQLVRLLEQGVAGGLRAQARVIATTHRNLAAAVSAEQFRADLFYRLSVLTIDVPPLREHMQDLHILVRVLTERAAISLGTAQIRFTDAAMRALARYHFPGNVRELANLIEQLALVSCSRVVDAQDLPPHIQSLGAAAQTALHGSTPGHGEAIAADIQASIERGPRRIAAPIDLRAQLDNLERHHINCALLSTDGKVAGAARLLQMHRTTLIDRMRKLEIRGARTISRDAALTAADPLTHVDAS
jgi:sigma-54 dependent transcriptional regulator, flagellar regulatory protein